MATRKRIKLKTNKTIKKKKRILLTIPEIMEQEDVNSKITTEDGRLMRNYFYGCERIGAVLAKYFKGMGDRIEVYDLDSPYYVGAIYPDGASMLWPTGWWEGRTDVLDIDEDEPLYSEIMHNKKLRNFEPEKPKRKRVKLKLKRVKLKRIRGHLDG